MEQGAHPKDFKQGLLLVCQSENCHHIKKIQLICHSTNLFLCFINSDTYLLSSTTEFCLKQNVLTPMYKLDGPKQNVVRDRCDSDIQPNP